MEQLEKISQALQKGKAKDVKELVQAALDEGLSPEDILNQGLLAGMNVIGIQFKNNEIYVPDVLIAARAMKAGTEILKPLLVAGGIKAKGRVVIGTVRGDLHDIGKNLVAMMMEGQGLEIVDAGTDVPPERFIELAIEHNAQIIACSALLTTTMNGMKDVVEAAGDSGIRKQVVIMVGGAPVTDAFARSIGADLYAPDAASAAEEAVKALDKLKGD
jgi:corrinoid protein of di/trimethylamine methyltransferase